MLLSKIHRQSLPMTKSQVWMYETILIIFQGLYNQQYLSLCVLLFYPAFHFFIFLLLVAYLLFINLILNHYFCCELQCDCFAYPYSVIKYLKQISYLNHLAVEMVIFIILILYCFLYYFCFFKITSPSLFREKYHWMNYVYHF